MTIFLKTGGRVHGGWKSVEIQRSIETISGAFNLEVTEKYPGASLPREINIGDFCEVRIDSDVLITGYVNDVNPSFDARTHTLQVAGRDRTGDLVDCSAMNKPGQWKGLKLERIAEELAAPFGITVMADTDTGEAFKSFILEQGETVFDTIERMCRLRAVMPVADGKGGLLITRAGTTYCHDTMTEGENGNILRASGTYSDRERFSEVTIKGQTQGGDNVSPTVATGPNATARDEDIKRYRPLLIFAEGQASTNQCKARAAWEVANRKGKGYRAEITVQGWRQADGSLWDVNKLVRVNSPLLKLNETLLIASISYILSPEEGTVTKLSVARPEAFQLIRELAEK
jgi:prophage tail gpP-like protein